MGQETHSFETSSKTSSKLRHERRKRLLETAKTCPKQHSHKGGRHEEPKTADQPLQKRNQPPAGSCLQGDSSTIKIP
ncbi:hypothetical protein CJ030_MR1G008913 [Morella rubra]|uniref:Uncharacterized protein n=1 Tax=Morella rubra TaxID=262757 RepID=A0A6A1WPN1_9ROSI|nr:hypothetical protein CJ030_MR1G008913 [Morella rubra]